MPGARKASLTFAIAAAVWGFSGEFPRQVFSFHRDPSRLRL
jgi:hypothetical protein